MKEPIRWRLVLLLGAFALIRPALRMTGIIGDEGFVHPVAGVLGASLLITFVWVIAAVQSRTSRPVMTLVLAGVAYAIFAAVLSLPFSVILEGQLAGPLLNPFAMASMVMINALWGAVAGVIAWSIAGLRRRSSG